MPKIRTSFSKPLPDFIYDEFSWFGNQREDDVALVKQYFHKNRMTANINAVDKFGFTGLSWAASYGCYEVCKFLIEQGADVNQAEENGWTPLLKSAFNGRLSIVRLLCIEGKANVEARSAEGCTVLDVVQRNNQRDIIRFLTNELPLIRNRVVCLAWEIIMERDHFGKALNEICARNIQQILEGDTFPAEERVSTFMEASGN